MLFPNKWSENCQTGLEWKKICYSLWNFRNTYQIDENCVAKQKFPLILKGCLGFLSDHSSFLARFSLMVIKQSTRIQGDDQIVFICDQYDQ